MIQNKQQKTALDILRDKGLLSNLYQKRNQELRDGALLPLLAKLLFLPDEQQRLLDRSCQLDLTSEKNEEKRNVLKEFLQFISNLPPEINEHIMSYRCIAKLPCNTEKKVAAVLFDFLLSKTFTVMHPPLPSSRTLVCNHENVNVKPMTLK